MSLKFLPIFYLFQIAINSSGSSGGSRVPVGGGGKDKDGFLPKSNRVVGGRLALKNEIPYIVALVSGTPPHSSAFCGGSIVDPQFIVTAAHCFEDSSDFKYSSVLAGSLNANTWEPQSQNVDFKKIILHESFDPETFANDIAIVQLAQPLKFNDAVQPISIPVKGTPSRGKARVSGWGETNAKQFGAADGFSSELLKTVELDIVSRDKCSKLHREIPERDVVYNSNSSTIGIQLPTETHICAGDLPNFRMGSCNGDSGGPLVCSGKQKRKVEFYLCGISSAGSGCANKLPGWYTEVAQFHDWILQHTN